MTQSSTHRSPTVYTSCSRRSTISQCFRSCNSRSELVGSFWPSGFLSGFPSAYHDLLYASSSGSCLRQTLQTMPVALHPAHCSLHFVPWHQSLSFIGFHWIATLRRSLMREWQCLRFAVNNSANGANFQLVSAMHHLQEELEITYYVNIISNQARATKYLHSLGVAGFIDLNRRVKTRGPTAATQFST